MFEQNGTVSNSGQKIVQKKQRKLNYSVKTSGKKQAEETDCLTTSLF